MFKAPYFHREGRQMELRVPLSGKQKRHLKAFLEAFPGELDALTDFHANDALGWLDRANIPEEGVIDIYCDWAGKNPRETFEALAYFHKLGWVSDSSLESARAKMKEWEQAGRPKPPGVWDDLAADIRADIKKGGREPEEMEKLRALLVEIEGKIEAEAA